MSTSPDPRVEAAARVILELERAPHRWDEAVTSQEGWRVVAESALDAADEVDPLRQPDVQLRFVALAAAMSDTLDVVMGIADDFIGARIVGESSSEGGT